MLRTEFLWIWKSVNWFIDMQECRGPLPVLRICNYKSFLENMNCCFGMNTDRVCILMFSWFYLLNVQPLTGWCGYTFRVAWYRLSNLLLNFWTNVESYPCIWFIPPCALHLAYHLHRSVYMIMLMLSATFPFIFLIVCNMYFFISSYLNTFFVSINTFSFDFWTSLDLYRLERLLKDKIMERRPRSVTRWNR